MHRLSVSLAAAAVALLSTSVAFGLVQPTHLAGKSGLELADGTSPRRARAADWNRIPPQTLRAWTTFVAHNGGRWQASFDRATGVPSRIFGEGVPAPGTVASPDAAASFARQFLSSHLELLAPGARLSDFVLVSNHLDRHGMRTLGFEQYHQGMRVLGGQVSFRFKNDRLFVIGSEALPNVAARPAYDRVAELHARGVAVGWVASDSAAIARDTAVEGPFILPIVPDAGPITYRTVVRVTVDAEQPIGRWDVYVDANDGHLVAREQTLRFATATIHYNVPLRHPGDTRADQPARGVNVTVDGATVTTSADGLLTWVTGTQGTALVRGPLVRVNNQDGAAAAFTSPLADGGTVTWNAASDERVDAQLTTYIHGWLVKNYARSFAPDLPFLDEQLIANVNINDTCNAYSDGRTINFFVSNQQCQNTARLADVIYHEFGHSLHAQSIIQGVGAFDGAFSEGLSDYLAATITDDPGMGRGFFHSDAALRHIDPVGKEHVWPDDIAEIHYTGLIYAGAMWDLRKIFVEKYGYAEGVALADRLFYAAVQRASDIPSTYVEALAADDDDGNLANGSPNFCDINRAFAAHGLRALDVEVSPLAAEPPSAEGYHVTLQVNGLSDQCEGDGVDSVELSWRLRDQPETTGALNLVETDGLFVGDIPEQPAGQVVNYQVEIRFADGTKRTFPDNLGDPWYEFFVGEVVELYCTDFETDPWAEGWTHALDSGQMSEGADDWMWGELQSPVGSGDPRAAFSGTKVIGNDLGGGQYNGLYQSDKVNHAMSPVIDVGNYSDVRIQYWRWLNVEDAFFDAGTVYVNGQRAWQNFNSNQGNSSNVHHTDREWRFHDIPASQFIDDGKVQVKFEIKSDGGLEFGGWTLDDFCVVAYTGSVCGDGEVSGAETCDEGANNSNTEPDACRLNCRVAYCGDGVVDSGEQCDDGNDIDDDACSNTCTDPAAADGDGGGCGCTSADPRPGAASLLLLALVGLLTRRTLRPRRARLS